MKILEISLEKPSQFSGGGIGICQSLISLNSCGEVDYIGPEMDDEFLALLKNTNVLFTLTYQNGFSSKCARIKGIVDNTLIKYYPDWKKIYNRIQWDQYDYIHIEFTKYEFLVKDVLKKISTKSKIIVRAHNVETDFSKNLYKHNRTIRNLYIYKMIHKNERYVLKHANTIIALDKEDKRRLLEVYNVNKDKIELNPICINDVIIKNHIRSIDVKNFLITGSLWYGPNAEGIIWFLDNVWSDLYKKEKNNNLGLVIAGRKPSDIILQKCKNTKGVKLICNPNSMESIFQNAYGYIAPIFSGAGMKVKVAEAMNYGLPIIGTDHAFVGYVSNTETLIHTNTITQFRDAISHLLNMDRKEYLQLKKTQKMLFKNNYSMKKSIENYKKIFKA